MKGNDKRKIKAKDKRKFNLGNRKKDYVNINNDKESYFNNSGKNNNDMDFITNGGIKTLKLKEIAGFICIIGVVLLIGFSFVKVIGNSNKADNDYSDETYVGFTGKQYFEDLGIDKSEAINIIEGIDEAKLVNLDGVCIAKASIDNEVMYRFQVEKNGEKSYDMEISELMSSIHIIDSSEEPYVKVSKHVYKTKDNKEVKINYYDIYVQESKIKNF